MPNGYTILRVEIAGDGGMVMHNGQTANPLNPYAKAIKQISGKRKKVDADHEAMAEIEWEAGLYLDDDKGVYLPGYVVEACIVNGAKKTKDGQTAKTCLFVDGDAQFFVDSKPVKLDELRGNPKYQLAVPVKVQTSRVMRTRPMFKNWSSKFTLLVMKDVANTVAVKSWVENAGSLVGLCDWRPRYGRFRITSFKEA
jgi:hypothetical protein